MSRYEVVSFLNFMDLKQRAKREISISLPYFILLSDPKIDQKLYDALIKYAPIEFYSLFSQLARHIINGTFCVENPSFCLDHKKSIYLLASPEAKLLIKKKVLLNESRDFISLFKNLIFDSIYE